MLMVFGGGTVRVLRVFPEVQQTGQKNSNV
jgi:hypothetical protein